MGLVLGTLVENSFSQAMIIFNHDWTQFFHRPIALVFFSFAILGVGFEPIGKVVRAASARRAKETMARD